MMSSTQSWRLFAYRPLAQELASLRETVLAEHAAGKSAQESDSAKRLRHIRKLMLEDIPADPASARFRLGNTLGAEGRKWRRAKFLGRYRLFFRYDSTHRIIVYCWVNNEESLRTYASKTDAYATFQRMLTSGAMPSDLINLVEGSDSV
jgi:toxin YhaV